MIKFLNLKDCDYFSSKNEQIITASIFHVHAGRFLVTTANDAYYLDGPIDRQSALQLGQEYRLLKVRSAKIVCHILREEHVFFFLSFE